LSHGKITGRSIEDSLAAAKAELRRIYDGRRDDRTNGSSGSGEA
jgi:hypothetical protein